MEKAVVSIGIRVSMELKDELRKKAEAEQRSMSKIIIRAIRLYLKGG